MTNKAKNLNQLQDEMLLNFFGEPISECDWRLLEQRYQTEISDDFYAVNREHVRQVVNTDWTQLKDFALLPDNVATTTAFINMMDKMGFELIYRTQETRLSHQWKTFSELSDEQKQLAYKRYNRSTRRQDMFPYPKADCKLLDVIEKTMLLLGVNCKLVPGGVQGMGNAWDLVKFEMFIQRADVIALADMDVFMETMAKLLEKKSDVHPVLLHISKNIFAREANRDSTEKMILRSINYGLNDYFCKQEYFERTGHYYFYNKDCSEMIDVESLKIVE